MDPPFALAFAWSYECARWKNLPFFAEFNYVYSINHPGFANYKKRFKNLRVTCLLNTCIKKHYECSQKIDFLNVAFVGSNLSF